MWPSGCVLLQRPYRHLNCAGRVWWRCVRVICFSLVQLGGFQACCFILSAHMDAPLHSVGVQVCVCVLVLYSALAHNTCCCHIWISINDTLHINMFIWGELTQVWEDTHTPSGKKHTSVSKFPFTCRLSHASLSLLNHKENTEWI